MIKKLVCAALSAFMLMTALVGCTGSDTMQDGTYRAEMGDYDSHGWKDYVVVTVKDGKYSTVEFDSINKDNQKKSADEEYAKAYPTTQEWVKPAEYTKQLPEKLMSTQDIEKVDTIATATTSTDSFKKLVTELNKSIKKGKTDTVIVSADAESK